MKLRLQPIRVLCFHQVSDVFDENSMYEQDWLQTDNFKGLINQFKSAGYQFISLEEAHEKLQCDRFRRKKYVVLTADDGWASLKNILPWLNEQKIPITLFLNPAYFDGIHYRNRDTERYLTQREVEQLHEDYPLLTIGSHGWEHTAATMVTEQEFTESVEKSIAQLGLLSNYIPYFAYTWGWHSASSDKVLLRHNITPVCLSGGSNCKKNYYIDREILKLDIKI